MAIDNLSALSPGCVRAQYSPQRIPHFKGNPLIEALPPSMTDDELIGALTLLPELEPEQQTWPSYERLQMLLSLKNFMVPFARHVGFGRTLDSLIRSGYVGRAPLTAAHAKIYQTIYEKQKAGIPFRQAADTITPQLSTASIGLSGMGKTTAAVRYLAHLPQVIYHPELNVYQVTYLHIETPSGGSSMKALAHAILNKLDELIPGSNYYKEYSGNGRAGADSLMPSVARLMHTHFVGLLICDEVQNLTNANKGGQTLMTELVSACNALKVPILFIGTNKAKKILGLDFRQARRSCGHGTEPWTQLAATVEPGEVDEWREFLDVLWHYQWVSRPSPLTEHLRTLMYHYSQGNIDIAIKLFASTQARAIADGSESVTPELIADVFNKELQLLHPMIEALRNDDIEALSAFDDIAPLQLQDIVDNAARRLRNRSSALFRKNSPETKAQWVTQVATSLVAAGCEEEDALAAAQTTAESGQPTTVMAGIKLAGEALATPRKVSRPKTKNACAEEPPSYEERPNDYRRAITLARQTKVPVLEALRTLGHVRPLEELLELA